MPVANPMPGVGPATQCGDQAVVAPATDNGGLAAHVQGLDLKDRSGVVIQPPNQPVLDGVGQTHGVQVD